MVPLPGFSLILAGDFNAHTGNEPVLGFQSHSHACNNNGELLIQFCLNLRLSCLNTIAWGGSASESVTFRRDFGDRYVESILDYGLVASFFLPKVVYITTGKVEQKGEEENKQGETQRPLKTQ